MSKKVILFIFSFVENR